MDGRNGVYDESAPAGDTDRRRVARCVECGKPILAFERSDLVSLLNETKGSASVNRQNARSGKERLRVVASRRAEIGGGFFHPRAPSAATRKGQRASSRAQQMLVTAVVALLSSAPRIS